MNKRRHIISLSVLIVLVIGSLIANLVAGNTPALGLDLQGGASVTLQPDGEFDPAGLDVAVEIIRARVDSIGVAEPEIILQGSTVIVNLPGVKDQQQALDIIGRTGELLLRPVLQSGRLNENPDTTVPAGVTTIPTSVTTVPEPTSDSVEDGAGIVSGGPGSVRFLSKGRTISSATTVPNSPTTVDPATSSTQVATSDTSIAVSTDATQVAAPTLGLGDDPNDPTQTALLLDKQGIAYVVGPAGASGKVFKNDARADVQTGQWAVVVGLRSGPDGDQLWNKLAAACFNKTAQCPTGQLAMVLDGTVISAPTVNEPEFTGGTVQISGSFTPQEARDLAKILEFGAVPVRFGVSQAQTVSATLGSDSLRAALISGLVGILLVSLLLFAYYRLMAIFVLVGMSVSIAFLWSVISLLSRTNGLALSLSGIAGIIVSIGIAVDSYIVFFERIKDEIRFGKTLKNSALRSFESAWRTIVAADTVSFIAAIVLWYLTVGSVRGFAFFLGISALTDILITYFFTRSAVLLFARSKRVQGRKVLGIQTVKPEVM
ncbi:MAG: protein translocase subunit SecD [Actinobacteria bacterium]|nr:protein translocase subunit SecD [Actinomycetota bacterium]NCU80565.1 protein translocase subunit SecD [Acidimicrobiia bacterium]NBP41305.1 protein translocase subunit SecD [Actinomycetota bacterium]NBQ03758.1 protein translocase subunit SecD [Actinomycetota bacterium]NBY61315.1 protein translocase subunit SecD [Actinomycetota bacterium]